MKNVTKKTGLVSGTLLASAVMACSSGNLMASGVSAEILGNGAELRSELLGLTENSSQSKVFEMKCGEDTKVNTKKSSSDKKTDAKKMKSAEHKCGEGKCGANGKATVKTKDAKATNAQKQQKKSKGTEGKCGQGKCGVE